MILKILCTSILCACCYNGIAQNHNCFADDLEKAFAHADIIFSGKVTEIYNLDDKTMVNLSIIIHYKGNSLDRRGFIVNEEGNCKVRFSIDEEYLVYGKKVDQYKYKTDYKFGTKKMANANRDINFLNLNAPCKADSVASKSGCQRIYAPVCGCDGVTYSNACEAANNGISRWRISKCH